MSVQVVTDSTSDLPPGLAAELGITVVPLTVFFGDTAYRDGVDLDADRFFELLQRNEHHPRTSQPSPGAFEAVYEPLLPQGPVLSIHISSQLSGTLNSANAARTSLAGRGEIEIVDSRSASLGLGLAAVEAARRAREGADLAVCAEAARSLLARERLYFILDTLEYLRRGGRIGRAQALVGSLLSIKPVLTVSEGLVAPFERVRAWPKAVARLRGLIAAGRAVEQLAVMHGNRPAESRELAEFAGTRWPGAPLVSGRFGPVIGTYTGPGALGVCIVEAA